MDHETFARCWTQTQPVVANYVSALVPDLHTAEDLLQDIAVVILQSEYDQRHPFTNWALGIARNRILQHGRDNGRRAVEFAPGLTETIAAVSSEKEPDLEERTTAMRHCIEKLGEKAWKLIALRYDQLLSAEEIGKQLGMNGGAVRMALARIRATLQACVQRQLGTPEREP